MAFLDVLDYFQYPDTKISDFFFHEDKALSTRKEIKTSLAY